MVTWGVWLARNASVFEDKKWPTFEVSLQSLALFSLYKHSRSLKKPRYLNDVLINKKGP